MDGKYLIPKNFVFENGGNTCYISSLLVGLFYNDTEIYNILENDLYCSQGIYIQQFIKYKIINHIRNNKSIKFNVINILRDLIFNNKFKIKDEINKQQDVSELYSYLVDLFNIEYIFIQRNIVFESDNKNNKNELDKLSFIPLSISNENIISTNIKELLDNWMYDNKMLINNNKNQISALSTYEFKNTPQIIALYINRFGKNNKKLEVEIDIQKISPYYQMNNELSSLRWSFHCAICHYGDNTDDGHYYTLLVIKNKWYIFNDLEIPCISEVSMADRLIIKKKLEKNVYL